MSKQIGFSTQILKDAGYEFKHPLMTHPDPEFDWLSIIPSQEQVQQWLESKGVYIAITPDLYADGINWNWSIAWYLPKAEWQFTTFYDDDNKAIEMPTRIAGGTGWYGDNGEYPTRHEALDTALQLGIKKLDPLYRNNSSEALAKLYCITQNELLTKIRPFSAELGDWSFREFTEEQLTVIVKHLGNPLK